MHELIYELFTLADMFILSALAVAIMAITSKEEAKALSLPIGIIAATIAMLTKLPHFGLNMTSVIFLLTISLLSVSNFQLFIIDNIKMLLRRIATAAIAFICLAIITMLSSKIIESFSKVIEDPSAIFMGSATIFGWSMFYIYCKIKGPDFSNLTPSTTPEG